MSSVPDYAMLVDERTGLISALEEVPLDPRLPRAVVSWQARAADGYILADIPSDKIAGGTYFDRERARLAAIGEVAERYAGNYIGRPLLRGSYEELTRQGYTLLDPAEVPLYSESQYATRGFPFVALTRDLRINWVEGYSKTRKRPVWVPASLVYVNYFCGEYAQEPPTNFVMFAGIAGGSSLEAAVLSGLLEVIERDATTIWWASNVALPAISLANQPRIRAALTPSDLTSPITYKIFNLTVDIPVPVMGALLYDPERQIPCMGFACRFDPHDAVLKAVGETAQLYTGYSYFLDPNSGVWSAVDQGIYHARAIKPYRADRSYRGAFRPDYHDMIDLLHNGQYYLDPSTHSGIGRLLNAAESAPMPVAEPGASSLDHLVAILAERNLECIYVDLTTPDMKDAGLSVVRVLVPGMVPNAPTAFPFLGPRRLYEVPVTMGWAGRPLTEAELNLAPLPHS
ncbi:MAG: YcaO-like family protein [Bacillota bacterium]